jgi:hypothetical protein
MSSRPFIYSKEHYNIDRQILVDHVINSHIFTMNHTLAVLGYATAVVSKQDEAIATELSQLYTKAGWDVALDNNVMGIVVNVRDKAAVEAAENLFKMF